jgi:hypothetical protein
MICIDDLASIINSAYTIRMLKPNTGNPVAIKESIAGMSDRQITDLFLAMDEISRNVIQKLGNLVVTIEIERKE